VALFDFKKNEKMTIQKEEHQSENDNYFARKNFLHVYVFDQVMRSSCQRW
jgi:hypothetical protein